MRDFFTEHHTNLWPPMRNLGYERVCYYLNPGNLRTLLAFPTRATPESAYLTEVHDTATVLPLQPIPHRPQWLSQLVA